MAFPWGGDVVVVVIVIVDVIVVIVVIIVIIVIVVGHKTRLRLYLRLDPKTLKCSSRESAHAQPQFKASACVRPRPHLRAHKQLTLVEMLTRAFGVIKLLRHEIQLNLALMDPPPTEFHL